MIQVSAKHISPFASEEQGKQLVKLLQQRGWLVEFYAGSDSPVWEFDSWEQWDAFLTSFEKAKEALKVEPFEWVVSVLGQQPGRARLQQEMKIGT